MNDPIRDILLVRLSALGDVTLMLPVVATLQAALPHARITWLTSRPNEQFLAGLPGVELMVMDKPRSLGDYARLARRLRERRFDVLLAMQASLRANLIYPLVRAPLKIGYDRARARDGQWLTTNRAIAAGRDHLLDGFFRFLDALGVAQRELRWQIPLAEEDRRFAERVVPAGGPLLAVVLSASKRERNWPTERLVEVLRAARERWKVRVALIGGRSQEEQVRANTVARALGDRVIDLTGCTTPKQLAAVLARVDCLLAPDTGPVHIACAMGTPVVGLYAVAPSALSGPYLRRELVVDKFDEAARRFLGRDPDVLPWGTRVHDARAMALIEPAEVLEKLACVFGQAAC